MNPSVITFTHVDFINKAVSYTCVTFLNGGVLMAFSSTAYASGNMVARWLTLMPHSKTVVGLILGLRFCGEKCACPTVSA